MSSIEASRPCAARRVLLFGVGAAALVAVAACGGEEPTVADAGGAAPGPSAAPSSPPPVANPFATDGDGGGGVPPPGALVVTTEVPVGGGVVIRDSTLVVQPAAGTFKAFEASCPHQGVTVEPPSQGATTITCPGHNSQFRAADGSLLRGPATRGLKAVPVKVQDGYVVEV